MRFFCTNGGTNQKRITPMIKPNTGRMETPYVQNHQIPALRQGNRAPGSTELRQSFYDTTAYKQKGGVGIDKSLQSIQQ